MSEHKKYMQTLKAVFTGIAKAIRSTNGKQSNLIGNDLFLDVSDNSISMEKKHLWHLNGQKKI